MEKEPYTGPELVEYGTVAALTAGTKTIGTTDGWYLLSEGETLGLETVTSGV